MQTLKEAYNIILKEAVVRKKLDNFTQIVNSNPDLKIALELCLEIEKMEPKAEALIVGGSVRDILLNKKPKDVDIATNVDIEKIEQKFKSVNIGASKDFGIVSVSYKGMLFEVSHYRQEDVTKFIIELGQKMGYLEERLLFKSLYATL